MTDRDPAMMTSPLQLRTAETWPDAVRAEPRFRPPSARMLRVVAGGQRSAATDSAERSMEREYVSRGGLARGDELLALVRTRCDQPISRVARWIVGREAIQYRSGTEAAFPLFQFELSDMSIRPAVAGVIAELSPALDDIELAEWFVRPNATLAGAMPADVIDDDPGAVIAAARADRFVIRG
jgi:hypothetical protein